MYRFLISLLFIHGSALSLFAQAPLKASAQPSPPVITTPPTTSQSTKPAVPTVPGVMAPAKSDTVVTSVEPKGAPVVVGGKEYFRIFSDDGPYTAAERAQIIGEKLSKILNNENPDPALLRAERDKDESRLFYDKTQLCVITANDAAIQKKSRYAIEQEYLKMLGEGIKTRKQSFDLNSLIRGAGFSLIATLGLALLIKLLFYGIRKLSGLIDSWRNTRIGTLKIQNVELLSADRITDIVLALLRFVRFVILLTLLYFYLPFLFSFFPWTQGWADILFGYILSPLKAVGAAIIGFVPNLFFIGVIIWVTRYLIRVVNMIFTEMGRGTVNFSGFHPEWAAPTYKIIRFLIIAFSGVMIFPYLPGSNSPAFQGVSIFFGVLFSLGSTSAIANVVAGVVLTYMRPFKEGDLVKIADTVGDVMEKTLLVTRIKTSKNVVVTVPNSMILSTHMTNYSSSAKDPGLILHTSVTNGYDVDWRVVQSLLLSAAKTVEEIEQDTPPFVLQTSLDDFYVNYELNAYTERPNQMAVIYSKLHAAILDTFNAAGIEIMSPHFYGLRDGNAVNLPADSLPKKYQAPAFRIKGT
ncbi:MAG TPA: mechanosensitive ion channel [Turneriella sp.]|nr:mechanosensitive ion channel [Turneriella sp.]